MRLFEEYIFRSSRPELFYKKVSLKISQNLPENTSPSLLFNKVSGWKPATLLKNRLQHRFCPVNFAKNFKNTYFVKHVQTTAFVYCQANTNLKKSLNQPGLLPIHLIYLCQICKNKKMVLICLINSITL